MRNTDRDRKNKRRKVAALFLLNYFLLSSHRPHSERRFWVRPSLRIKNLSARLRNAIADDEGLTDEQKMKKGCARALLTMPMDKFKLLLKAVTPLIEKQKTREPISPLDRLVITLRYLATGSSYIALEDSGISEPSLRYIIPETCQAINYVLQNYIKTPTTENEWKIIESGFRLKWNFPHCIGAVDGRHCPIVCPPNTGSDFYNYKHFFSIILMAVVDANYNFLYVNVGAQGRRSDGGVWNNCSFSSKLQTGSLNLPNPYPLPGRFIKTPYLLVTDDAFAMTVNTIKPYPGITEQNSSERVYNYRLSRARRVVENVFGILSARFQVLQSKIGLRITPNINTVILATCYLHNFIGVNTTDTNQRDHENDDDISDDFSNDDSGTLSNGKDIRDEFAQYFISDIGKVPWDIPY